MKIKYISTIVVFLLIISTICITGFALSDKEISFSERRPLSQFSDVTKTSIFSSKFSTDFEKYMLDQTAFREPLRKVKAFFDYNILLKKDNNDIYRVGDYLSKIEYPLKDKQVLYCADKINEVNSLYLGGMNVYYSIIPDKNYFLAENNNYPTLDYKKLVSLMNENVKNAKYIDIFDALTLESYYKTDTHWKQTEINEVLTRLTNGMNVPKSSIDSLQTKTLEPFYGVYYGQAALKMKPDEISYLTNENLDKMTAINPATKEEFKVYSPEKLSTIDGYEVFLSGAQSLIEIKNERAKTDRELIIFRDSFSSSLAPLLTDYYSKITLVDLRYIKTSELPKYIEFKSQDVLFLYNTSFLNSNTLLK
ncbi:MAG: DHHW family protein [Oscillospiraceae bacterium]